MLQGVHVLLVDDEPELREIFAMWLERSGCRVTMAAHGRDGLASVANAEMAGTPIQAVICDQRMPEMDGATMVRTLHARGVRVPVLLFASIFGTLPLREAYSIGVHAMLGKPLRRHEMIEPLERCLLPPSERWAMTPAKTDDAEPEQHLHLAIPSLAAAQATGAMRLGSGGINVSSASPVRLSPLSLVTAISLHIDVVDDQRVVEASGCVRWMEPAEQRAGIELLWVAPESRAWLAEVVAAMPDPPYIPA